MSPEEDPHPFDLEVSLVKSLVGAPRNRTAWEVCSQFRWITLSYPPPPFFSLAMATPYRETCTAQGLSRPLECNKEQDEYRQTSRCYHFPCRCIHCLSTRIELVSHFPVFPHALTPPPSCPAIRFTRPLEMQWITPARSFLLRLSIPRLICPLRRMTSTTTKTKHFTSSVCNCICLSRFESDM